jgi:hypothetical protein
MSDVNQTYDPNRQVPPPPSAPPFFAPLADPNAPVATPTADEVAARHTAAEEEYLEGLYAELKPLAVDAYIAYFLARTPAHLQDDMKDLVKADLAIPPEQPALMTSEEQRAGVVQAGPGVDPCGPTTHDPAASERERERARHEAARQNPDEPAPPRY